MTFIYTPDHVIAGIVIGFILLVVISFVVTWSALNAAIWAEKKWRAIFGRKDTP